jgi:hypothetical protein
LPFVAGASYNWLVPAGAVVSGGQGTNSITVNFGAAGGNISADISNACGTGPRVSRAVSMVAARPAAPAVNETTTSRKTPEPLLEKSIYKINFDVYPNPVQSKVTAVFNTSKAGARFEIVVSNTVGTTLFTHSGITLAGKNMLQFDLGNLPQGIYLIRLITPESSHARRLFKAQ